MGREKAKDYADSLIDTVAEAVGTLDAMPQAAAEAVRVAADPPPRSHALSPRAPARRGAGERGDERRRPC